MDLILNGRKKSLLMLETSAKNWKNTINSIENIKAIKFKVMKREKNIIFCLILIYCQWRRKKIFLPLTSNFSSPFEVVQNKLRFVIVNLFGLAYCKKGQSLPKLSTHLKSRLLALPWEEISKKNTLAYF
jgi:hypothetical protein